MKSSFKTLFTTALLGLAALPLAGVAQDAPEKGDKAPSPPPAEGGGGGNRRRGMPTPEQQVARIDEAVTLTADQKTKITEIFKKSAADMQAVPQEERREKGMAIMKATHDEIRALLTPEQQTKFDAMPQPGRRGQGGGGGGGGRPPGDAPKKE
jgi:protein CpxP